MRKRLLQLSSILLVGVLLFSSCSKTNDNKKNSSKSKTVTTSKTTPTPTPEPENPELLMDFDFDEHNGEYITNKAKNKSQHVEWLFDEINKDRIFKAPSNPLFKQGVGLEGQSLYMDGHSTKLICGDIMVPNRRLTASCWIAPRGFENLAGYGGNTPARDKPRLTSIINQGNIEGGEGFLFGYGRLGKWGIQMHVVNNDTLTTSFVELYDPLHTLELYQWNHVAVSMDLYTGYVALYYNGERAFESFIPELENTSIIESYEATYVGYYCLPQLEYACERQLPAGLIDNVKLYRGSLKTKDIRDEYNKGCVNSIHPDLPFTEVQEDRSMYEGDRYRTIYHGIPSAVWMNEPHSPIYYKGWYHLFYQHNPIGPYWSQIRWAHLASQDMMHWVSVKDAVVPTPGICPEGVWTGGSVIGPDGTPWLVITAGTNQYGNPSWSGQNVAYAHCVDPNDPLLTDWVVEDKQALTQLPDNVMGEREQFRDPFVWYDEGKYYMLVSTSIPDAGGSANVFTSKNMRDWEYHGYLYQCPHDLYPEQGIHWECVVMFPISTKDGSIKKWILFDCPQYEHDSTRVVDCYYWIGQFNKETCRFIADDDRPQLFDLGKGIYTGQTGFCYLTEEDIANGKTAYQDGRTVLFGLAQGKSAGTAQNIDAGWAHSLAMPVELHLDSDERTVIREPLAEIASLYDQTLVDYNDAPIGLDALNSLVDGIRGDALEIKAHLTLNPTTPEYSSGFYVRYNPNVTNPKAEKTAITFNNNRVFVNRSESSDLSYPDKSDTNSYYTNAREFDVRILLDRSSLEVYINDRATITTRIYPKFGDSDYLHFFDTNGDMKIDQLSIKTFKSAYYDTVTPAYYGNTGNLGD